MVTAEKKEIMNAVCEEEEWLFRELDKGIDDMEQGRTFPFEESLQRKISMSYKIKQTQEAENDLCRLSTYIIEEFKDKQAARKFIEDGDGISFCLSKCNVVI